MDSILSKQSWRSGTMWKGRRVSCVASSSLGTVEGMCKVLRHFLADMGLSSLVFPAEVVARECMNNAVFHGNRCRPERRIGFDVVVGRSWVRLQVADQGEGFDWRREVAMGPPDKERLSGRGLAIVRSFAHRMVFNDPGNQITVWFKKDGRRKEQ